MKKTLLLFAVICPVLITFAEPYVKVVENRTGVKQTVTADGVFSTPKKLTQVNVFANGGFTNSLTLWHAKGTNDSQSVIINASAHSNATLYATGLTLIVMEGDVLYVSNSVSRCTTRLVFE